MSQNTDWAASVTGQARCCKVYKAATHLLRGNDLWLKELWLPLFSCCRATIECVLLLPEMCSSHAYSLESFSEDNKANAAAASCELVACLIV